MRIGRSWNWIVYMLAALDFMRISKHAAGIRLEARKEIG
jgi:hypothetical protein